MSGRTMTSLVEDALRASIDAGEAPPERKLPPSTFTGRLRPGVDVNSRKTLYDLLDDLSPATP